MKVPLVLTNQKRVVFLNKELSPKNTLLFSKNINNEYKKQLESHLFYDDREFDFKALLPILVIMEYLEESKDPIKIVLSQTPINVNRQRALIGVMREFISENYNTLREIMKIYKSKIKK